MPEALVPALAWPQIWPVPIGGGSSIPAVPSYTPRAEVHDLPPQTQEVVASAGEAWVLLGRDALNTHRLLPDNPRLLLEVG